MSMVSRSLIFENLTSFLCYSSSQGQESYEPNKNSFTATVVTEFWELSTH